MTSGEPKAQQAEKPQRLHLVFGGELKSLDSHEFRDVSAIDIVGLFPDYASAEKAWRAKAQETIGFLLAGYLRLVQRTSRFVTIPDDLDAYIQGRTPLIAAMWHGQHIMMPLARPKSFGPLAVLISRHEDAGAQAIAARRLGITPIRGSGGPVDRQYYKGGAPALRALLRELESGSSVALTADVPKRARVAGAGIVTLAKLSGRPIVPTAVVMSRRMQFDTWDRATLGLPFGRAVVVAGEAIQVAPDADDDALERARLAVQEELDEAHRRGYAMVGSTDPGALLRTA